MIGWHRPISGWRTLVACCGLAGTLLSSLAVYAGEPVLSSGPSLPRFHRLFLPLEEIENRDWKQRYLPVDAAEFQRDLAIVADGARGVPTAARARLERAEYQARLVGDDLLVGDAMWTVSATGDQPALVSLAPCSLAIESATWSGTEKSAVLGADPAGELRLLVEGGQLSCNWSRSGERTAAGAVRFQLELPACPTTRMRISLPPGAEVVADQGVVIRPASESAESGEWLVELGGHHRVTLRIVPEEAKRDRRPLTLLRQAMTYEFSARGVNVGAQLRLDVHGEPLTRLQVDLDPSLNLIGAKFGEEAVPWSATTDRETGQSQVHLEFPEPLSGTGRVLQLSAVAPLTTDRRFVLPRIQPQGVAWQEGTSDLLIPDSLVLEQLQTTGCRQSRVTALPAPLAGESIEIQNFEAAATVEVLIAEPRKRLALERATLVEVGTATITGRCTLGVAAAAGQPRRLSLPVRSGWIIDAVESSLPNRTVEWDLHEGSGELTQLQLVLVENERVVVQGHRDALPEGAFDAGLLLMFDWSAFRGGTSLISVRAAEGLELRWTGTESLARHETSNLSHEQLGLFTRFPEEPVFSDDDHFAQATVSVARRKPSYAADIHIDVAIQKDALTETFTILCTPDASRVERLLVHLSQPREMPLEWRLAGGNNSGQFSARKLSAGEQAEAGLRAAGEVWELLLQLARPGVFELRGQRKIPFAADTAISLVSVEEATTQRGTLAIRALGDLGLSIKNRGLMSVPAELLEDDRYQTARATYHYQPSGDDLEAEALVSVSPAPRQQAETGAWAWNVQLISRFASDGVATHEATFHVETAGRRRLALQLPPDASLHEAWIDAEQIPTTDEKTWTVELPAGRSRATLTLRYSTVVALPRLTSPQEPPFPRADLPILQRTWTVWLPPEYRLSDAEGSVSLDRLPPTTWSERLFGPLGRGADDHVFNPLVAADWQEVFSAGSDQELAHASQSQLLESFGALAADYADDEELTCGQLLAAVSESEAQSGRVLLVDAVGLAEAGITPQTRLAFATTVAPRERALEMLRQAGLLAVAAPSGVLITTTARAAVYRDQLLPARHGPETAIARGSLAAMLRRAARGDTVGGLESIEFWRAAAINQTATWLAPPNRPLADVDPRGWRSYILQGSPDATLSIRLVHAARLQSLAWAVLLAVVGCGLWKPRVSVRSLVILSGIAAAASLIVPPAYAPLFSAALLGGLFCLAARLIEAKPREPAQHDAPRPASRSQSSFIQPAATAMLLLALVNIAAAIDAAEPAGAVAVESARSAPPSLFTVLVPIDAEQQPVGNKYYVPDALYEDLLRRAAEICGRPRAWVVSRGAYVGALSRDPATSRIDLSRLEMKFDLQVFQTNLPVQLPLPRDAWGAAIRGARLDGRSLRPEWNSAGDALVIGSLTAGAHRLELDVLPALQAEARSQGFDLPIPRLGQATLELSFPQDLTSVEVPSARGRVERAAAGGELRAQLGASERLSVRWPTGNGADVATPNLEVEELIWVKVRPGTTVLDARFTYRVLSGRVRTLRLLMDSRLRLLSSTSTPFPLRAVHTIPGDPQRVELDLAEDVADQVTVDLSFLVTGASGVGSLRLPRLESVDARPTRRWLGMSVDPALQHRVQAGEDSRAIEIAEFLTAWGNGESKPLQAFSIPRGEPIWFLATQPGEPQMSVEQTTTFSLSRNTASVRFDAKLAISGGVLAQLALEGPANFTIDSVSVREQDVERVARWSIDAAGRISVFLTTPVEGPQQLSLRGRWVSPATTPFVVPRWKILGAATTSGRLLLYRQPAVLATIEPTAGARPLEGLDFERSEGLGAPCGAFALDEDQASVEVSLTPNEPQLSATAITYLHRSDDKWVAELHYHVDVAGGLVDSLQFEIPPQWSEPFRVEPGAELTVLTATGEQRRQLTLTPAKPLSGKHSFTLRGRVAPSPGDRLSMPDILPLHVADVERFVVLPRVLESQQVTWDTLRLSPARLPAEFLPRDWQPDQVAVYQVSGEHFQASLKAVERERAAAHVKLADIHVAWLPGGGYQACAMFDVEPGGATNCLLEMPPGCELIHLAIEQLPTSIVPAETNKFRIALGPQQLPQRIELLYTGPPLGAGSVKRLQPPRLVGLKVTETLWTVYGEPRFGAAAAKAPHERLSAADRQLIRLEAVAELVQLPAEVVGEHLPEEIARWYDVWRKRYWTGRASLRRDLIEARRDAAQSEESIAARQLDRQMTAMDQRLGAARAGLPPLLPGDLSMRLAAAVGPSMRPQHFVATEKGGDLHLRYAADSSEGLLARWLAAAGLLFLCGVAAWWLRRQPLPKGSPAVLLSGLALAWWLLLSPSFLGLVCLILIGCAAAWVRWPQSPQPA
jgi:hypothetical protein